MNNDNPNARFWFLVNGDYVKITLQPGQKLDHKRFERHDEGWSGSHTTWELHDGIVYMECDSGGCDCDGPLSSFVEQECKLEDLAGFLTERGMWIPAWGDLKQSQRDYYAEAMGY